MLALVEQRIEAVKLNGKPLFVEVQSALALSAVLKKSLLRSPVAYVVPIAERPGRNERTCGPALQSLDITFGVVIGLQSINDPTGKKGNALLESLRTELRNSLFGWTPASEYTPIALGPGDIVAMTDAGIWWLDKFTLTTHAQALQ